MDEDIQTEWLKWMQQQHIPDVMATNCFVSGKIFKVLDSPNEGVTYSVQYVADDLKRYEVYRDNFASKLQADLQTNFANKFVAFRTIMELIEPK